MWSFFSRDPTKDFPFEIGEVVSGLENKSVWSLHKGKKRGGHDEVSVFVLDVQKSNEVEVDIAKTSLKKLKTIRHPNLLCYLDSCESDKYIYVATEYVEPLSTYLENSKLESQQNELFLSWGLFQVTRALSFLNNDGNMKHNNVCLYSVFVTASGEWKLGGFEFLTNYQQESLHNNIVKIYPALNIYDPPEKKDSELQKQSKIWCGDMWGLGCLIWEIYNGPLKEQPSLNFVKKINSQISGVYCELVATKPGSRPNPADIITRLRKQGGFFKNALIDTLLFLEEIQIKEKTEKTRFFSNLSSQLDSFPDTICVKKILPQLLTAFNFGDAGSAVLGPMFKLGRLLDESEYQKTIVPCIVQLFSSNDRTTRSRLLIQLDQFINHIHNATVNDQIFPQLAHGFLDTNPVIREQTVKSIVHLAPKLNYNNLNVEVLKHFARLQSKDDQGGIRTNTTVCLGKVAAHLHPQIRQKVLVSAFVRATRDPFPPARQAGVLALAATQQYFLLSEVAIRILPALCPLTADPEKQVRDAVFRTIRGFLGKLEKVSEDPSLKEGMEADVNTATPSLSNAAATWAGWAVTAVTAKFYRSHSDTARAHQNPHRQMLSKPASLEQPSSSSMSTTTSSVTSMTSLEHSESASDYDPEHWDSGGNWGDMEANVTPVAGNISRSHSSQANQPVPGLATLSEDDGWGIDDWGTLEELETNDELASKDNDLASPADSWSGNAAWSECSGNPVSGKKSSANEISLNSSNLISRVNKLAVSDKIEDSMKGWEESEFDPIEEMNGPNANGKMEEMRKKREERKLQRQREMEARRTARTQQGPMKLAMKKN